MQVLDGIPRTKVNCDLCSYEFQILCLHISSNRTLFSLLERWDMESRTLAVEQPQDSSPRIVIERLSDSKLETVHTIHLWEISLKS